MKYVVFDICTDNISLKYLVNIIIYARTLNIENKPSKPYSHNTEFWFSSGDVFRVEDFVFWEKLIESL